MWNEAIEPGLQNSQARPEDQQAVIRSLALPNAQTDRLRFLFFLVLCWGTSVLFHIIIGVLFLFVTVGSTSANLTRTQVVQTLIEEEKPVEANLTNDEIGVGLNPDELLNLPTNRIDEVTVAGPANPAENIGNLNNNDANLVNVPPPPGFGSTDGQGGGAPSAIKGLMNPSDLTGGMIRGILQPGGFGGRSGATRQQLLNQDGGNTRSEAAVASGLKWIALHQAADGHWSLDGFNQHGRCNCIGFGMSNDIAGTAFGLLPLLGAGETHKKKDGVYKKHVEKGLKYLILKQARDGNYGGGMYAHGLATIAMCEAYGLTSDPILKTSAQRAINFIRYAQSENGGWRYEPRSGGDTSVAGWQIMAIKSGQMAGLEVDDAKNPTLAKSIKWLKSCATADETGYGYIGPDIAPTMTSVGLLCRLYLDRGVGNTGIIGGAKRLVEEAAPAGPVNSVYYYYYATQVLHHIGGRMWESWNPKMRDFLIQRQDRGTTPGRKHLEGSWSPAGDAHGGQGGRLMITSLSICTLEVYYRHLPLYRRNLGGNRMAAGN